MSQIWSWIADIVLGLLLVGTLGMTFRLDRALRVVRRDRTAFEALISNLGAATNAVKVGIQALRNEADRAAGQIERRSEEADKMATDLSFLIEAADRAGAKLEERLLAVPKVAVVESRSVSIARRLAVGGHFMRRRRAPSPGVAEATSAPLPVEARAVELLPTELLPTELVPAEVFGPVPLPEAPLGLRERAGITTRRRGVVAGSQWAAAVEPPARAESVLETVIMAETGEERVLVKMAG